MNGNYLFVKKMLGAKGPAWLIISSASSQVLLLAAAPIIARSMGPEARGIYYPLIAFVAICSAIAVLGTPQQYRLLVLGNVGVRRYLIPQLGIYFFISSCLAAAFLVWGPITGLGLQEVLLLVVTWFSASGLMIASAVLIAKELYRELALIQFLLPGVHIALALTVVLFGIPAAEVFLIFHTVGTFTAFIFTSVIATRLSRQTLDKSNRGIFLANSVKSFFPNVLLALFARIDLVVVLIIFGPKLAGIYSIAVTATAPLMILHEPLSARLFSAFQISPGKNPVRAKSRSELINLLSGAASLILLATLAISLIGYLAVEPLFGSDFQAAGPIAAALALTSGLAVLAVLTNDLVIASGVSGRATVSSLIGLALSFLVFLALSSWLGIYAMVVALGTWFLITMLLNFQALSLNPAHLRFSAKRALQTAKGLF